jgi:hypothetical protein
MEDFSFYMRLPSHLAETLLRWSDANGKANDLLRSVLTGEEYHQLMRNGYLDIPSPRDQGCVYRVPRAQGLVGVIEQGRCKMSLCLQSLEWVPDADMVAIHKLMIEADEETYLQTANKLARICNNYSDDCA